MTSFTANETTVAHLVTATHDDHGAIAAQGNRFDMPAGADSLKYRINLDAAANQTADIDVAYKMEDAWISAGSTWLLQPAPLRDDTFITVSVNTPAGTSFATGMDRDAEGRYTMTARRIHAATYGVFGRYRDAYVEVPGPMAQKAKFPGRSASESTAKVHIVVMPGEMSLDMPQIERWTRDAALAVGEFWGGFPLKQVCVVVLPMPGHEKVVHGKVTSAGGATIALQVGSDLEEARLHDDWILVHEFFHLGFPTFPHANKWLDEGLATYYEPIIRTRAGWRSEQELWQELAYDMPQGLAAMEQQGLDNAADFHDVYWGGAMLAFIADTRIRERSNNRLSLEDGLRAVLAQGGHAGTIWTVERAVAVVDEALGMPVLGELVAKHRTTGAPVGFPSLLKQLGVTPEGTTVVLDDSAELAPVRRLMTLQVPPAVVPLTPPE